MDEDTRRVIGFFTIQFVAVAALIHLSLGVVNWIRWLEIGFLLPRDLRWPVFVVSGVLVFAGIYRATRSERPGRFYLAGIAVMLGYVLGYFGWHLGGHRLLLLAGSGPGTTEALSVQWFLDHLFAGPLEFSTIVVESAAAAGLAALYLTDEPPATDDP